ncbi:RNA-binding domain-containing protein [Epithele typhae]|uniref:RNA-binding domain-containing protein n=1 Tax=Epithele typhae TaxID=378194 RepID=UPI002007ECD5|nr:RNA-binding domain-containing protein [Epithele typhae]KAH9941614.1 RNA-binding domain-containing protein [Epithele typhae]
MAPQTANRAKKPYTRPAPHPAGSDGQWLHDKAPGVPRAVQNAVSKGPGGVTNTRIIVSNLHYEVTPKDLTSIFGQIGTLIREPQIRYDRSGRSSGVAVVTFETPLEATRAKKQFDGILCKNQPMSVVYDTSAPKPVRNATNTTSLLNRIEKPPLIERLTKAETKPRPPATQGSVGPMRTKTRGPTTRAPKREKPKTADELDKELDAFMNDDIKPIAAPAKAGGGEGDVDMA